MMEYKGYTADAFADPESGGYSGIVLNVSDTIHFEADTLDQAEAAFRDSVDDYLEFCRQEGVTPCPPSRGELRLHLEPSVYAHLITAARDAGENVDSFIGKYLGRAFAKN